MISPFFDAGIINAMLKKSLFLSLLLFLVLATGCQSATPAPATLTPSATLPPATPTPTRTPPPPTPTPVPMALIINNEGITLSEYESELLRLQAALKEAGKDMPAAEQKKQVLDQFTEELLLAQAAFQNGFSMDDVTLQKRLDDLAAGMGGKPALEDWLKRNFYTDATFRVALRRSLAAASMRDSIINQVPKEAEQVHARQILVLDSATAERLYKLLEAGTNFATLAFNVDPDVGGDLGWFPRGYLFLPEIEKIAFELQPGKYSPVIKTAYGYHIVQVIEHHQSRPLSVEAYRQMQRLALSNWLAAARQKSQVTILAP